MIYNKYMFSLRHRAAKALGISYVIRAIKGSFVIRKKLLSTTPNFVNDFQSDFWKHLMILG